MRRTPIQRDYNRVSATIISMSVSPQLTFNRCPKVVFQFQILRKESQDPVATAIPSSVTPKQLTLLSCPARTPEIHSRMK